MREEYANLVHPVFTYALRLKERLERGERPNIESEQMTLKGLLMSENEAKRWIEFGGQGDSLAMMRHGESLRMTAGSAGRRSADQFLGIRYALACWLDEIFTLKDSPWEAQWADRTLETALYGSRDRAWMFWDQAQLAERRPGSDALEVFYLCVMLGFRGELREDPDKLKRWADAIGARIGKEQSKEWPQPPELEVPSYVPPLYGRERFQRMVVVGAVVTLSVIPILAFFLVRHVGK
jgi:type VI secretion system protein ImpK